MANPAHLEKLCGGAKPWNAWRSSNPDIVPDLSDIRLSLHQRQLGPSNGGPVDLHAADLERASLPYATLTGADLSDTRLVSADLTHARLDQATLIGADLTDAILDQADLMGAVLDHAVLFGTDLSNARNLTVAQLEQAYGDARTKVPASLTPPQSWYPAADYDEDEYSGWGVDAPIEENLYEILGLTVGASSEEIRTAYRNLVKRLHPDINPDDEEAQERFKRVSIAYKILNDPAQRQRYDRGEIDGEGRVSPEFEARRQYRRTTFRYFGAAIASFLLAGGALAAVWWTVLSIEPRDEPAQLSVSQPKTSERLSGTAAPVSSAKDEGRTVALRETLREFPAQNAVTGEDSPLIANLDNELQQPPVAETQAPAAPAIAKLVPGDHNAKKNESENPIDQRSEAEQSTEPPNSTPSEAASPPLPAASDSVGAPPPTPADQAALNPPPAEDPHRPLREQHKEAVGQTTSSAPERWSVAAPPQGGPERKVTLRPDGLRARKQKLWRSWQEPIARDLASQVLRGRAIEHSLGKKDASVTASEAGGGVPERSAGLSPDAPTNAIPSPQKTSRSAPRKRATTAQQRRPEASRVAERAQGPQSAPATSFDAAAERQAARQRQAVSDVFAGGF